MCGLSCIRDQDPKSISPKQPINLSNGSSALDEIEDGGCTCNALKLSKTASTLEYDTFKPHARCKFTSEMKLELRRIPIGTREMH